MTVGTYDYNENNAEKYFENEQFSDIRFEVGPDNDSWSVPAHKRILQKACPALEPLLQQKFVRLEAIDKRAFSTFLKFLYTSKVEFSSIQTARETLNICYQFVCTTLAKKAVYFLDLNLNKFNVLDVYKNLQFLCNNIPSAPTFDNNNAEKAHMPLTEATAADEKRHELHDIYNSLLYNCLLEIDANMSWLLKNEKMLDFCLKDLLLIFQRDTLKITSELELLTFIDKWACCECKNRNLSLAIENKRELLKTLFVTIRFGTLTKKEFQNNAIIKNGLLLPEHYDAILNAIENPRGQLKQNNILGIFYSLVTPRNYISLTPVVISERSAAISKNRSSISNRSEPSPRLLNFLRIWTCLFD